MPEFSLISAHFKWSMQHLSKWINEILSNTNHTADIKREDGVESVLKFMECI